MYVLLIYSENTLIQKQQFFGERIAQKTFEVCKPPNASRVELRNAKNDLIRTKFVFIDAAISC
jgi:hypothetical protein